MHFYILRRRETGLYVLGSKETDSVSKADRFYSRKLAQRHAVVKWLNTTVCGPYMEDDYEHPK